MPSLQTTPPQHARGKSHGLRSRDGSFLRQLRQRARPSVFVAEDGYRGDPNIQDTRYKKLYLTSGDKYEH